MDCLNLLQRINWLNNSSQASSYSHLPVEVGIVGRNGSLPPNLFYLKQIHSTLIHEANHGSNGPFLEDNLRQQGDGIWTDGVETVGVKTADCLPILLISEKNQEVKRVGAVHAGWRGLFAGILESAIKVMLDPDSNACVHALIGPAISQAAFEVGPEVMENFLSSDSLLDQKQQQLCLKKGHQDRWHINLVKASIFHLLNLDLQPTFINVVKSCTFFDSHFWYSYRRAGYHEGSNWSWIRKSG